MGTKRNAGWLIAAALSATLIAGVDEAAAKKPVIKARIAGKKFKARGNTQVNSYTSASVGFAGAKPTRRIGGVIRALAVLCLVDNFPTLPLPATLQCGGEYEETKLGTAGRKTWGSATGLQVTFESFDGTRARGVFSGVLDQAGAAFGSTNPGDPPVAVENGRFNVVVTNLGF